jgi:lysophospholipase
MLLDAAADGDLELIKLMYHSGFKDLNEFVNVDNRNVAHIAVCCKQLDVLFFLKYQVHFNFQLRDRWQRTPLDEARMLKSEEVVEILTRTID